MLCAGFQSFMLINNSIAFFSFSDSFINISDALFMYLTSFISPTLSNKVEISNHKLAMDISVGTVPPISVYQCQAFRSNSATYSGSHRATISVLTVPL